MPNWITQTTLRLAAALSLDASESVEAIQDLVQYNLTKAEKENLDVYLLSIPCFSDVPVVTGALLVKAVKPTGLDAQEELFVWQ